MNTSGHLCRLCFSSRSDSSPAHPKEMLLPGHCIACRSPSSPRPPHGKSKILFFFLSFLVFFFWSIIIFFYENCTDPPNWIHKTVDFLISYYVMTLICAVNMIAIVFFCHFFYNLNSVTVHILFLWLFPFKGRSPILAHRQTYGI